MVFAIVVCVLLAIAVVVLVVLLASARRGASAMADARDDANARASVAETARDEADAELTTARAEHARLTAALAEARRGIDERDASAKATTAELSVCKAELTAARAATDAARAEVRGANAAVASARASTHDAAALWAFEVERSERRWRTSVAPGMHLDSPFVGAVDPLPVAIDIEAAATREEVGTRITVRWHAPGPLQPEVSLLALRSAQEMLAALAKAAETVELVGTADGRDLLIAVRAADEDGGPLAPLLPSLPPGRLELSPEGIRIRGAFPGD
jgi:hypothetical protein